MGRPKGSKNKKYILDPKTVKDPSITKTDIHNKMKVLSDFGFSKEEIRSLFQDKDFENLRALDCFTSNIIKEMLNKKEVKVV